MKRTAFLLTYLVIIFSLCLTAYAESAEMYAEYIPRTATGTVFYVDIYCEHDVSAAVFELGYDTTLCEYRDVSPANESSTVKANADGGKVKIAFADSAYLSGRLLRVTFKAISTGTADFSLHMTQGVDGDLAYITGMSDYVLSIALSKSDVVSSSKASTGKSSYEGEKSGLTMSASGDEEESESTFISLIKDRHMQYFLLMAGAAALAVLLIVLGIVIGRKTVGKKPPEETVNEGEETEENE